MISMMMIMLSTMMIIIVPTGNHVSRAGNDGLVVKAYEGDGTTDKAGNIAVLVQYMHVLARPKTHNYYYQ